MRAKPTGSLLLRDDEPASGPFLKPGRAARATAATRHGTAPQDAFAETRGARPGLGLCGSFEQIVRLLLTAAVSCAVVAALAALLVRVAGLPLLGMVDPAEPAVFQAIFGNDRDRADRAGVQPHAARRLERRHSAVQASAVVLIAPLATARKFLILELKEAERTTPLGLAGAALALGGACWLVGDRDRRDAAASEGGGGTTAGA